MSIGLAIILFLGGVFIGVILTDFLNQKELSRLTRIIDKYLPDNMELR